MPNVTCIQSFSSGDGIAYESGVEYDVPAAILKVNPTYFEKESGTTEIYTLSLHDALPI